MTPKNGQGGEPLVARDATYYRAPDALRARIRSSIGVEARRQFRPKLWTWGGMAAGMAAASVISWNVALMQARVGGDDLLEREVASAHVRSLMAAGHLNDVVSTDQHTVKPWFNGKLDVAPPVVDLAAQGFTLIGGRLDYVDTRPIGAIVYRRRSHVINLFVAQTSSAERRAAKLESIQGFNIRRWSERGLNYWAVSDLAADELAEFGEKFEAALRSGTAG
jgi:anti-sigma factor RsiW